MSTCQRSIKLINEETSRKIKLVQKTLEELCNFETEEYWNKISRLDTKLVNVLQGNKTFGALISNNQKSYISIMDTDL